MPRTDPLRSGWRAGEIGAGVCRQAATEGGRMPVRGLHHLDLAVAEVERSGAFYLALRGPLGLREMVRYPTYRGTEDVVYLGVVTPVLGFRPADGGSHQYYGVG